MRIWFKEVKDNRIIRDYEFVDTSKDTRTHKVFRGLEKACVELDLAVPAWLENIKREFKIHSKARFYGDAFIEELPFDYLEIQVLEED